MHRLLPDSQGTLWLPMRSAAPQPTLPQQSRFHVLLAPKQQVLLLIAAERAMS